jgi:Kef-type K+ transport system membrane component KefB
MEPEYALLTIGVALILGKIGDHIIERFELPGVLGEIFIGMLLGNLIFFGILPNSALILHDETFEFLAKIGIIFLLFLGGLDTEVEMVKKTGVVATVSTIGGVFVPLILGYITGFYLLKFSSREAFTMGVLLTATSIGITVRVMMDLGVLRSEVGAASLSASIMDDFLGIALIIFAVGSGSVLELGEKIALFFFITGIIAWYAIDKYVKFAEWLRVEMGVLALSIGLMFIFSALAEKWFQAAIEGAFMSGLVLSKLPEGKRVMEEVRSIGYGLFIPLFFVYVGAQLDLRVFTHGDAIKLATIITLLAILGKVLGRGIFARLAGWDWRKSIQMGIGSIPRLEVALVAVMVAIHGGAIPKAHAQYFMAATLVFVTVTTLITPPLLKLAFKSEIEAMKKQKVEKRKIAIEESKQRISEVKK